jgi:hypothetical protein
MSHALRLSLGHFTIENVPFVWRIVQKGRRHGGNTGVADISKHHTKQSDILIPRFALRQITGEK